ncbi:hypothetical protein ACU4GR_33865 (plasmid) [Methylobacterium oryzae CBMB20]
MVADQWCVELVSNGAVIRWTRMPSCEDAVRVAGRVSLRDRAERLPMVIPVTAMGRTITSPARRLSRTRGSGTRTTHAPSPWKNPDLAEGIGATYDLGERLIAGDSEAMLMTEMAKGVTSIQKGPTCSPFASKP